VGSKRQTATTHTVSGHFWADFLVTLDCLGKSFPSKIAGHPVEIVIPGRDANPDKRELLPPAVPATKDEKPSQISVWGNLTNWMECTFGVRFKGHDEIEMAKLSRIGLLTTIKTHDLK
jgi:hypothetical protein